MNQRQRLRRKTDRRWPWVALAAFLILAAGQAWSWKMASDAIDRVSDVQVAQIREGVERRDQICLSAEREHLNAVTRLDRTYRYLVGLTPREARTRLNEAILRQLPEIESEARTDVAPLFCDEPGERAEKAGAPPVGLPEPDPEVPQRPAGIPPLP